MMIPAAILRVAAVLSVLLPCTAAQSLDSPFAVERRLAAGSTTATTAKTTLSTARSARGRRALLLDASERLPTDDLKAAFLADSDPALRSLLARRLAERTDVDWSDGEPSGPLLGALRLAGTERALDDAIAKNVDPDGELKGFYDGQFRDVARRPGCTVFLARIAGASWRPELQRVAAIHALGESTSEAVTDLLTELRTSSLLEFALPDPEKGSWRVPVDAIERYVLLRRFHALDHARSRHGDERGLRWRIEHHLLEHRRLLAARVYVRGEREKGEFRSAAAWELFEVAYLHGRLGEIEESRRRYESLIADFPGTSPIPTAYYNLACLSARAEDVDASLKHLRAALRSGYADLDWMMQDAELMTVRQDPRFAALIGRDGGR